MFHEPTTKDEAAKYRYGRWAGRPFGDGYDAAKCAAEVSDGWMHKQCAKKPGHGPDALYCSMHAKKLTTAPATLRVGEACWRRVTVDVGDDGK